MKTEGIFLREKHPKTAGKDTGSAVEVRNGNAARSRLSFLIAAHAYTRYSKHFYGPGTVIQKPPELAALTPLPAFPPAPDSSRRPLRTGMRRGSLQQTAKEIA
jgi:hypothetical protein